MIEWQSLDGAWHQASFGGGVHTEPTGTYYVMMRYTTFMHGEAVSSYRCHTADEVETVLQELLSCNYGGAKYSIEYQPITHDVTEIFKETLDKIYEAQKRHG